MTTLAAATLGVGALTTAPPASALTNTCDHAMALAKGYLAIGGVYQALGMDSAAAVEFELADATLGAGCYGG